MPWQQRHRAERDSFARLDIVPRPARAAIRNCMHRRTELLDEMLFHRRQCFGGYSVISVVLEYLESRSRDCVPLREQGLLCRSEASKILQKSLMVSRSAPTAKGIYETFIPTFRGTRPWSG